MSEESDDKQFDPSESKLRKARQEGDIPRSTELQAALGWLGFALALIFAGAWAVPRWVQMAGRALGTEPWPETAETASADLMRAMAGEAALQLILALAIMAAPVAAGIVLHRALLFTPKKLLPDLKRISPVHNAKQKLGATGLGGFALSLTKVMLVGLAGALLFRISMQWFTASGNLSERQWVAGLGVLLDRVVWTGVAIGGLFAGIDLVWKRFSYLRRHRMTRREVQDEHKESEGDPHLKAARQQRAVDLVLNSMLADVQKADVVIVNPTHYAVALEWKRGSGRAPVCLAKGVDEVARRIRERAMNNRVPIWSDPPCARALHASVDIGAEIRPEHFAQVAAAIRFAEAVRKKAREGWTIPLRRGQG